MMTQITKFLLAMNTGLIFLISIIGRDLQHFFFNIFDKNQFYVFIALSFVIGFGLLGKYLKPHIRHPDSFIIRAVICIVLMLISQAFISIPEEKLHILLFAFLGFFCSFFPKIWVAISFALVISFSDEFLQHLLPSRYFGWKDVMINACAAILAIIIFRYRKVKE